MSTSAFRLLITIMQHKKVACPHIFINHVLPEFRQRLGGAVEVVLIQHREATPGTLLESTRSDPARTEKVVAWTEAGKFPGVSLVQHRARFPPYPSLPSYGLAAKQGCAGD